MMEPNTSYRALNLWPKQIAHRTSAGSLMSEACFRCPWQYHDAQYALLKQGSHEPVSKWYRKDSHRMQVLMIPKDPGQRSLLR